MEFQRQAIAWLSNFTEVDESQRKTQDVFTFGINAEERHFQATDETSYGLLRLLDLVFEHFQVAIELANLPRDEFTYDHAMELADKSMVVACLATDVGMALDGNWTLGVKQHRILDERREKRNDRYRGFQEQYQAVVDKRVDKGQSYSQATEGVAKEFSVDVRTVRNHTENKNPQNSGGRRQKKR